MSIVRKSPDSRILTSMEVVGGNAHWKAASGSVVTPIREDAFALAKSPEFRAYLRPRTPPQDWEDSED
jgi:hypothetical protein